MFPPVSVFVPIFSDVNLASGDSVTRTRIPEEKLLGEYTNLWAGVTSNNVYVALSLAVANQYSALLSIIFWYFIYGSEYIFINVDCVLVLAFSSIYLLYQSSSLPFVNGSADSAFWFIFI